MSAAEFERLQPLEYFCEHVRHGVRVDGRPSLGSLRPVAISVGTIATADGSATVKQGNTVVVCGVKLELAEPKPEEPDKGYIVANVDLPPLCHSRFKSGPPSAAAQAASQFVSEVLANSGLVDRRSLCVRAGKLCWVLYIDLLCINYDGNLLDTSVKALSAALRSVALPTVHVAAAEDDAAPIAVDARKCAPLPIGPPPISCSFVIYDSHILADPTDEEERFGQAAVTVVLVGSAGATDVCHLYKAGGSPVPADSVDRCVALAKAQAEKVRTLLDKAQPLKDRIA